MRKLNTGDVFTFARAIKASGIKDTLKPLLRDASEKTDIEDIGIDTVLAVFSAMSEKKTESLMYEFLAGPFEMSADDIRNMELGELFKQMAELVRENDFKTFFTAFSGMIGRN